MPLSSSIKTDNPLVRLEQNQSQGFQSGKLKSADDLAYLENAEPISKAKLLSWQSQLQTRSFPGASMLDIVDGPVALAHEVKNVPGTEALSTNLAGFERYPERALIMGRKTDKVLLNAEPDHDYINFLESIALGSRDYVNLESEKIDEGVANLCEGALAKYTYAPFFASNREAKQAKHVSKDFLAAPEETTTRWYDKGTFKEICESLEIETADGELFVRGTDKEQDRKTLTAMINKYMGQTGEVIIRETGLASGVSMHFVNEGNFHQEVDAVISGNGNRFLVEVKEDVIDSPSVIGAINNGKLKILGDTGQLLDDQLMYQGNMIDYKKPIDKKLLGMATKLGNQMVKDGYRGAFGFDYIRTRDGRAMPVECNARVTGAFYPHEVRQRLAETKGAIPAAVSMSFSSKIKPLQSFKSLLKIPGVRELLFSTDEDKGLIPFNIYTMAKGKFNAVAIAGSEQEAKMMKAQLEEVLSKNA